MTELYNEINSHLLEDNKPSVYLNDLLGKKKLSEFPFSMLSSLEKTPQSQVHHPEGNVWNHTMLVVDMAAKVRKKSKNQRALMLAALLHDIGKANTTRIKKGKITSYDHDVWGEKLAKEFLEYFKEDKVFIKEVTSLVRYHMQVLFIINGWRFADIASVKENANADELALLGFCDRMGRGNSNLEDEEKAIKEFWKKIKS